MPSLKDTKRRIVSVKSTQKITRAMKLVSSAKYARASQNRLRAKNYGEVIDKVLADLRLWEPECLEEWVREPQKKSNFLVVLLATDRGLCGGLNSNLFKKLDAFYSEHSQKEINISFITWGKRAHLYTKSRGLESLVKKREEKVIDKPSLSFVEKASLDIARGFFK